MTRREIAKEAVRLAFADLVERTREEQDFMLAAQFHSPERRLEDEARLSEIAMDVRAAEWRLQQAEAEYQAAIDAEKRDERRDDRGQSQRP